MRMKTARNVVRPTVVGGGGVVALVTSALGFANAIRPDSPSGVGTTNQHVPGQNHDGNIAHRPRHHANHGFLFDDTETIERIGSMRREGYRAPLRTFLVRALSFAAVSALILNNAILPVLASDYRAAPAPAETSAGGQLNAKFLPLGIGKSVVVDLPRDVKDVLVADPKIANAVVRSAQRAYIIGAAVRTNQYYLF